MANAECNVVGHDWIDDEWRTVCARENCSVWSYNTTYNEDYLDRDEEYGGWEE